MSEKHTPGPWRIGDSYGAIVADHPSAPGPVNPEEISAYGGHMVAESVLCRNRPLIAAAPDLLEALKELAEQYVANAVSGGLRREGVEATRLVMNARAAIRKVEGDGA